VVSISQADITSIVGQGLYIVLIVSAPMLITALIVGFIVSIFQAATQINEQTLSFVPKVVGVFVSIIACGPWMLTKLMNYTQQLYNYIITVLK
jgi:flagellar biosynthetic protein FliQ